MKANQHTGCPLHSELSVNMILFLSYQFGLDLAVFSNPTAGKSSKIVGTSSDSRKANKTLIPLHDRRMTIGTLQHKTRSKRDALATSGFRF